MIKHLLLFIFCFFFYKANAQVSWQKMPGPNESVSSLAITSTNIVYASTGTYGVFRSADEGNTWANISLGLPDSAGTAVAVSSDDKLFACTGSHGIYQYAAGVWSPINTGLPVNNITVYNFAKGLNGDMYMMAVSGSIYYWNGTLWSNISYNFPSLGRAIATGPTGVVYAGAFNAGVYKFDGLNNWALLGSAMPNNFVTKLCVSAADVVYAACNSNNIFRCAAAGGSWTAINTGLPAVNSNFISTDALNNVFIGQNSAGTAVYRSVNSGNNWSAVSSNIYSTVSYCFANSSSGKIYIGASGVFRSADGGAVWSDMNPGMDARRGVTCFTDTKQGTMFVGSKLGPWRSVDTGTTWQLRNTNITHLTALQILSNAAGDIICHGSNNTPKGAIYRSVNNGDTWTQVAANGCDMYTKIKQHRADTLWACSRFSGATSLSYSINNGATWVNNPLSISAVWDIDFSNGSTIFLGSESEGVSRSDNGGQNFTLGVGNTIPWYGNLIEVETDANGVIFAAGDWWTNILWYSLPAENGNNWTKFTDPDLIISGAQDLIFDAHNHAYLGAENGGVRMAYNTVWSPATNWLPSSVGLPAANSNVLELGFDTTGYIYAVCYNSNGHDAGLYKSTVPVNPPLSATYTFTGNGNWSVAANWANNRIPPALLSGNAIIIIDPPAAGECVLDVQQQLLNGATIQLKGNKKIRVVGNFTFSP